MYIYMKRIREKDKSVFHCSIVNNQKKKKRYVYNLYVPHVLFPAPSHAFSKGVFRVQLGFVSFVFCYSLKISKTAEAKNNNNKKAQRNQISIKTPSSKDPNARQSSQPFCKYQSQIVCNLLFLFLVLPPFFSPFSLSGVIG